MMIKGLPLTIRCCGMSGPGKSPVQNIPASTKLPKVYSLTLCPGLTQPTGRLPVTDAIASNVRLIKVLS